MISRPPLLLPAGTRPSRHVPDNGPRVSARVSAPFVMHKVVRFVATCCDCDFSVIDKTRDERARGADFEARYPYSAGVVVLAIARLLAIIPPEPA